MSTDLAALLILFIAAAGLLIAGLLRIARRVSAGTSSSLQPGRIFRAFPLPTGLMRRPAVLVSHLFFTWGLVVIALRLATVAGRVTSPGYSLFANWESFRRIFVPLHEWTALAMLAAIGFFLLRRWVFKPRHLKLGLSAEVILFWPALMLSFDLLHESAHVALLVESGMEDLSVVSGGFGHFFVESGFYTSELVSLSRLGLWGTLTAGAAALALAPFARNAHWFTGWLSVIYRSSSPVAKVAGGPASVSRKALLDAYSCTECGQCDKVCEEQLGLEAVRPSRLPVTLRGLVKRDAKQCSPGRWSVAVGEEVLDRCSGCGECDDFCPLGIELTEAIAFLRASTGNPLPTFAHEGSAPETIPAVEKLADE